MKKKNQVKTVNVNLGCGTHIVPSTKTEKWINIDRFIGTDSEDFLAGDAMDIPLEKNSVDYLLCDNVLEHIAMKDIPTVLHEIRRVLKVGGRALIMVPEFGDAIRQWQQVDHDKYYNPHLYNYLSEVIYGNQVHDGEFHRTPMTAGFLHYTLNMCGLPKHELVTHAQGAPVPHFPGMPAYPVGTFCRNAQLVAEVFKTT